ncbi:MAG: uroporphyrinogen decarboxylase family protein [Dehalococcoidia bacterium]
MSVMTKRERVLSTLRGADVDRVPVSFWGHDFIREWSAEGLAAAMLESVRTFDYDYLKVNPRATYYSEAWGCSYRPPRDPTIHPQVETWLLHAASDLEKVKPVAGTSGPFAEQLDALRLIGEGLGGEVPFVQTVFSPLSVVGRLANGQEPVRSWMTETPDALHGVLDAVTETLAAYSRACLDAGTDGIFFATTEWATFDVLTWDQYEVFGKPYDLRVLEAVQGAPFNILHVCRPNNMLDRLLDYPAAAVSWAIHAPGNASLADIQAKTDKAVMGGVDERHGLILGSPGDVRAQVVDALEQTGGRGFLLAPGCSISPQTPSANLRAALEAAQGAPA